MGLSQPETMVFVSEELYDNSLIDVKLNLKFVGVLRIGRHQSSALLLHVPPASGF